MRTLSFILVSVVVAAIALAQIVPEEGIAHIWGFLEVHQTTAPATPPVTSLVRIYAKDKSGAAELFYKNGAGVERDLSAAGGGSGPTRVTQSTDVTTTSNSAYSAASGLDFAVSASANYQGACRLFTSTAVGTTGLQIRTTGPASPTRVRIMRRYLNNSATVSAFTSQTAFNSNITDDGAAGSHATANFVHVTEIDLMLEIGGSSGTVGWAIQSEVNASSVTLYKGSYCEYQSY